MAAAIVLPTHVHFKNLTDQVFGRLTVVAYAGRAGKKRITMWLCRCSCGKETTVTATSLHSDTGSCGCLRRDSSRNRNRTHGQCKTAEYRIWKQMRERCSYPKCKTFAYYGGRGISVCAAWQTSFAAFIADMGPRPSIHHQIDRINNDGNYEPANCRWVTRITNARNTRANHNVEFRGRVLCLAAWSEVTGIDASLIKDRLRRGWSAERALTTQAGLDVPIKIYGERDMVTITVEQIAV